MGTKQEPKLGKVRLSEAEQEAIAEMVESEGFKVWVKKIVPTREVQIAGTAINAGLTAEDLWYYKGMSFENGKPIKQLKEIAAEYNKNQLEIDSKDDED